MSRSLLLFLVFAASSAFAGPMPAGSFEVQSVDDAGGGWVIHHVPGLGDRLWGCQDLAMVGECKQVYLGNWSPASKIRFLHISDDSQKAWMVVSVPALGDFLYACSDPEGKAACDPVELELRPPTASYKRVWPDYPCAEGCPGAAASSGGGLMGGMTGGGGPSAPVIESSARGNIWLSAAIKMPGAVNLYACRNLETAPECQLAIPDLLMVDRENIGFKKYDEVESKANDAKGRPLMGIELSDVDEGSAAERSKFREGDVIIRVDGFAIKNKAHFKAILMQYPATFEIPIELESEERIILRVRRKPPKEKK